MPAWLLPATLLALAACHTTWDESTVGGLRVLTTTETTGRTGRVTVDAPLDAADSALQLVAIAPDDGLVFFERATDAGGDDVFVASDHWESPFSRSNAGFAQQVSVLDWPIDAADPPLGPGRWRFDLRTGDARVDLDLHLLLKQDPALDDGVLTVRIALAPEVADDDELVRGTTVALARWRDAIYGPIGIEVDARVERWEGPSSVTSPGKEDGDVYEAVSAASELAEVTVFVVDRLLDAPGVLGISGGIPGALVPSPRSAVVVSALEAAGGNRAFSAVEEELFGETLAHEVGHYLGLFHPVELPEGSGDPTKWDGLDDTEQCLTLDDCEAVLAANLMFPSPVCGEPIGRSGCAAFVPQVTLTADQAGVAHRYVGVR